MYEKQLKMPPNMSCHKISESFDSHCLDDSQTRKTAVLERVSYCFDRFTHYVECQMIGFLNNRATFLTHWTVEPKAIVTFVIVKSL